MINLLSSKEKEELLGEEKFKLVLILEIIFLIFLLSLILILFSINIHIFGWVESQKVLVEMEEKKFNTSETQEFQKKINSINQNLSKVTSFYEKQVSFITIFEKISEVMSPGMYLTNVFYQKDISQINLSGYSPNRESLVKFKEKLELKEGIKDIYFPTSNWVKPVDIDFVTTFKITF